MRRRSPVPGSRLRKLDGTAAPCGEVEEEKGGELQRDKEREKEGNKERE